MTYFHEYTTDFTISVDENEEEFTTVEVEIYLEQTYAGCPAYISGPPEDCYPAEGPEWELDSIYLRFSKTHKLKVTEEDFIALFGREFFNKCCEKAEEEGNESPRD